MSVCVYSSVSVLFCVQVASFLRADPPSNESYRLCIDYETEKAARSTRTLQLVNPSGA
jgi:hypothetical protein